MPAPHLNVKPGQRITATGRANFVLPPVWRTPYEVSKLDDPDFGRAISDGLIRPDITRQEAVRLRQGGWEPPVIDDSDVATDDGGVEAGVAG